MSDVIICLMMNKLDVRLVYSWMNHIKLMLSCFRLVSFEAMVFRVK